MLHKNKLKENFFLIIHTLWNNVLKGIDKNYTENMM